MELKIPSKFKTVLDRNRPLSGLVYSSIHEFGEWLKQNNTKFFAEYTDHSLEHIEKVLETADSLIRNECRKYLTEYDIATLILATLLHDCAMHLSEDGFINLVKEDEKTKIDGFGDKPWNLLWADFLAESRRFSGRKLIALFGDADSIRHPPLDAPNELNGKDLLLCGEFLRRHHARLAHEIALFGVPGPSGRDLKLSTTDDTSDIADLAGIVARSHGLSIRDCLNYLQINYSSIKEPRGVHVPFLMALLRIADILQIQSNRAPKQALKVRQLKSSVSTGEWEMHEAIKNMSSKEYSETIWVEAKPKNVRTYLRIRSLLDQIQSELDSSWTVIGEIYGYDPEFREFGLKIRRIRSNIDDVDSFSKQVPYVPIHASFEVADTDLLKLLIGPLYGEKPEIGIRELIQNAVDAVNELHEYQKEHKIQQADLTILEGEVVISIDLKDGREWWVTISDKGIGMTVNTIKEYFLKAGASLRRSEIWKKTFEDAEGKSKILRSGRFGIGALAAFLVGDEIKVTTRHVNSPTNDGIEFTAQIDTEAIEIKRINRPIGTTIYIKMNEGAITSLVPLANDDESDLKTKDRSWDWYCLDNPLVIRKRNQTNLQQNNFLPKMNSRLRPGWYRIEHPDFEDIHWSYLPNMPSLVCNGIQVTDEISKNRTGSHKIEDKFIEFRSPTLSVFDFNANFPINIQRTNITTSTVPFQKELLESIERDFIAFMLVEAPTYKNPRITNAPYFKPAYYGGIRDKNVFYARDIQYWISTDSGVSMFCDPRLFSQLGQKSVLLAFNYAGETSTPDSTLDYSGPILWQDVDVRVGNSLLKVLNHNMAQGLGFQLIRQFDFNGSRMIAQKLIPYGNAINSARLVVSKHIMQDFENYRQYGEMEFEIFKDLTNIVIPLDDDTPIHDKLMKGENKNLLKIYKEWEDENWLILKRGECPSPKFDFEQFAKNNSNPDYKKWPCIAAEWYLEEYANQDEKSVFAQIWDDIIRSPVIPYDLAERTEKLAHAYKELETDIENYKATKELIEIERKKEE